MAITKTKDVDELLLVAIALGVFLFFTAFSPTYYLTSGLGRFGWGTSSAEGWMSTVPSMVGIAAHCVVAALVTWLLFGVVIDKAVDEVEEDDTPVECDSNDTNDTNCVCPDTNDSNLCDTNGEWL
jgi:hypothetical protein